MSYEPAAPRTRVAPQQIAADTWLIRSMQQAPTEPIGIYLNSLVITGAEPVVVDTGTIANRQQWLEDAFGIVEPADVRWLFLSHDDIDHTGNLEHVVELCPNATIVTSWSMQERHSNAFDFPLERCRWLNDGESFDAGDRRLHAVRPPVWDSPTTRGLFDERTGVYWAVDAFATPMPAGPVDHVDELDPDFWPVGQAMSMHHVLSPWLSLVDHDRYAANCDRIQALGMTAIASAHSPLITGTAIDRAFEITRGLPAAEIPPQPGQLELEQLLLAASPAAV